MGLDIQHLECLSAVKITSTSLGLHACGHVTQRKRPERLHMKDNIRISHHGNRGSQHPLLPCHIVLSSMIYQMGPTPNPNSSLQRGAAADVRNSNGSAVRQYGATAKCTNNYTWALLWHHTFACRQWNQDFSTHQLIRHYNVHDFYPIYCIT